jgi:hypothetical protein
MLNTVHRAAALLATACIASFWLATAGVELAGSADAVARVKHAIVMPGLLLLIPAIAAAGASGFALAKGRTGARVAAKGRRMPWIAANGLLVLVPCALLLDRWAAASVLDARFVAVQAVELVAGAVNLTLMALNLRDGRRLAQQRRGTRALA